MSDPTKVMSMTKRHRQRVDEQTDVELEGPGRDPVPQRRAAAPAPRSASPTSWSSTTSADDEGAPRQAGREQRPEPVGASPAEQQDGGTEQGQRDEQPGEPGRSARVDRGQPAPSVMSEVTGAPYSFSRFASSTEADRRERKIAMMIARPDDDLGGGHDHDEEGEHLPVEVAVDPGERDEDEVGGVEHELDAHEDDDRVAPGQHRRPTDDEEDRRQVDVVDEAHRSLPSCMSRSISASVSR